MNYEKNYCEMKNRLYSAVKESADVLLWLIREERINTAEFKIATACYTALYEQIARNQLEDDYDTWEWSISDDDEAEEVIQCQS